MVFGDGQNGYTSLSIWIFQTHLCACLYVGPLIILNVPPNGILVGEFVSLSATYLLTLGPT